MARIKSPGLKDAPDSLEAIPEGVYLCVIDSCEPATTSSGNPYIAWEASVCDDSECSGRKLFWNTSQLKQALWNLKKLLKIADVEYDEEDDSFETEDAIGVEILLKVVQEEYEGRVRNKVADYLPGEE